MLVFHPTSTSSSPLSNSPSPWNPKWTWITMEGPDAADFLHRVSTVNVKRLPPGQGAPGCFLTAQGKIRATFFLWRLNDQSFAFELDPGTENHWKNDLLAFIDELTFAEKFKVSPSELVPTWIFDHQDLKPFQTLERDGLIFCHHGEQDFGRPWVSVWGSTTQGTSIDASEVLKWRIEAARPWADAEITPATLPLEIGLGHFIAPNKGCYPGQEVIEKIISLGSPPKRLVQISGRESQGVPAAGTVILGANQAKVGQLTSVIHNGGSDFVGLAVVSKVAAQEGNEITLQTQENQNIRVKITKVVA